MIQHQRFESPRTVRERDADRWRDGFCQSINAAAQPSSIQPVEPRPVECVGGLLEPGVDGKGRLTGSEGAPLLEVPPQLIDCPRMQRRLPFFANDALKGFVRRNERTWKCQPKSPGRQADEKRRRASEELPEVLETGRPEEMHQDR